MKRYKIFYSLNAVDTIETNTYEEAESILVDKLKKRGLDLNDEFTFEPFDTDEEEL